MCCEYVIGLLMIGCKNGPLLMGEGPGGGAGRRGALSKEASGLLARKLLLRYPYHKKPLAVPSKTCCKKLFSDKRPSLLWSSVSDEE